jgi:N-acetylneuraminic acid mutarotase
MSSSHLVSLFSKHGLVVSGQNKMYMAGGEYPDGSASQAFWRYDPVLDFWQEMATMHTPRSELGLAMLDGHVYAVGGWEGSSRLDSVERYDPDSNTWSSLASLKMAVTSPAVVAHEGTSIFDFSARNKCHNLLSIFVVKAVYT